MGFNFNTELYGSNLIHRGMALVLLEINFVRSLILTELKLISMIDTILLSMYSLISLESCNRRKLHRHFFFFEIKTVSAKNGKPLVKSARNFVPSIYFSLHSKSEDLWSVEEINWLVHHSDPCQTMQTNRTRYCKFIRYLGRNRLALLALTVLFQYIFQWISYTFIGWRTSQPWLFKHESKILKG